MTRAPFRPFTIETSARVCLFGDHQDYLDLPVIAGAIDRSMTFHVTHTKDEILYIELKDLEQHCSISLLDQERNNQTPIDFFNSGLRVVQRYGCVPDSGLKVSITSNIPINAGVSSSSALTVGWIKVLLHAFGCDQPITPLLIGQMAFEAEVLEHNSPGGQMDQYTIAHGGLIFLETGKNLVVTPLPLPQLTMVLAESGIGKDTLGTLGEVRTNAQKATDLAKKIDPQFDLKKATPADLARILPHITRDLQPYFAAAIHNHDITQSALKILVSSDPSAAQLGQLMTRHHHQLSKCLKVSHPKIDELIDIGLQHGAYGAKIVGSGHGGCALFLVPENQAASIVSAVSRAGAQNVYPIKFRSGHQLTTQ